MTHTKSVDEFIIYLSKSKNASQNTLAAYERDLASFEEYAEGFEGGIEGATNEDIASYKKHLNKKGFSCSSVSRAMSSVRSYYKYLLQMGIIKDNPTKDIKNDKPEKKALEVLTADEISLLLDQPDTSDIKGMRDKAMLETMYATGMKVTELISLSVSDVNLQLGFIICHGEEALKNERTVYLYPTALNAIKDYLASSRVVLANDGEDALFVNIGGARMTRQGFWKILKKYAEQAGIQKTITPHTIRHSFATHLLENGADIKEIKEILGHTDIASTQIYANYIKSKMKDSYLKFLPRT